MLIPALPPHVVHAIFARHAIPDAWEALPSTGIANHIYGTHDVILRIATDDPQAIPDARTESVAAPVARAAGIRVPRLIAFDDSRELIDRPYSVWERIHGETLGLLERAHGVQAEAWADVGRELAHLHGAVTACPDPHGWLDDPGPLLDLDGLLAAAIAAGRCTSTALAQTAKWIDVLRAAGATAAAPRCFLHNDLHAMNVMCTPSARLLALIDWGDAGWGDPAIDFSTMPLGGLRSAVAAYEAAAPGRLGEWPLARVLWCVLGHALGDAVDDPSVLEAFIQLGVPEAVVQTVPRGGAASGVTSESKSHMKE